jgi:hypothetical protein
MSERVDVYVERGAKRVFACALEWPGWCRSGRDEETALAALLESAPRYAKVAAKLGFVAPRALPDLRVVQRVAGDATTDFGAPGAVPKADHAPVDEHELEWLATLIEEGWRVFDAGVHSAKGRTLRAGPRGGGRSLDKIVDHVREAEAGYLSALGWRFKPDAKASRDALLKATRAAVREGLAASTRGEIPAKGPRGGVRWRPRFFVRRLAWHTLDHLWEIEDRLS